MRMWMVDPKIMCRQHLLGEHVEHHMFVGSINKGISMAGYIRDNLMEPMALVTRHWELVLEMESRGYNHKSELPAIAWYKFQPSGNPDYLLKVVDKEASLKELLRRCPECQKRFEELAHEN